jgi:hypothetical protein
MKIEILGTSLEKFVNANSDKPKTFEGVCAMVTDYLISHHKVINPHRINCGHCFVWAYLVWALCEEDVDFVTGTGHVMVRHNGKLYDSAHLDGVPVHSITNPINGPKLVVEVDGMAWFWSRAGIHNRLLLEYVKTTFASLYEKIFDADECLDSDEYWRVCDIPENLVVETFSVAES